MTQTTQIHQNVDTLRAVYADLSRIGEYVTEDVILHKAVPGADASDSLAIGKDAVVAHESALIEATGGTLLMDVQHIVANDYFGAVLGILRARGDKIAMPFCGLWRFEDGRLAEHWENAYDAHALVAALME
jgi:hypothetical protein